MNIYVLPFTDLEFRFRSGVKDLEVMMQNVISSAFETVTTVEGGVELLDIFMHLSSREVVFHLQFNQITDICHVSMIFKQKMYSIFSFIIKHFYHTTMSKFK